MDETVYCIHDHELFSKADLPRVGAWEYSLHPSTEILCTAFRIGTRATLKAAKTKLWVPGQKEESFPEFLRAIRDPKIQLVARNAGFEMSILRNVFAPKHMPSKLKEIQSIPVERWNCTAAMSRSIGIPGSLKGSGAALKLTTQKDEGGKNLIRLLCMPRKPTKKDPSTRNRDPKLLKELYSYCVQDVDTDVEAFLKMPLLHPKEKRFWIVNIKMNLRGFAVDRKLTTGAIKLIALESKRLDDRVKEITKGKINSARQRNEVLKFVRKRGHELADLRANTVKEFLEQHQNEDYPEVELLQIRESISRSSTAKYTAFEMRSRSDGRARDTTIFFGAHTGRDAGTGLQPQNLFKSVFKNHEDVKAGIELIKAGDRHAIEALYPKPMELYASALRSCIVAPEGSVLEVGDFATIEVRVLFWLAGEKRGLKQIADGRDLYCDMAAKIYGLDSDDIRKAYKRGDKEAFLMRQLGKQVVLGAGFGIGVGGEKFQATAKQYGMDISLDLAQTAVRAYREMYPAIPAFWTNLERAAIAAVRNPTKRYKIGQLIWAMNGNRLTCQLPIGRKLSYFNAHIATKATLYGPKPTLCYQAVLSPSKIFGRVHTWGGKLAENVVQGVARDCLYEKLETLEAQGVRLPVLAVHDEAVAERNEKDRPQERQEILTGFLKTLAGVPDWAPGLPIAAEGWAEKVYRK